VLKKFLYIIINKQLGLAKIGITSNITRRKRQLECSSGCLLQVYHTTPLINHAKIIEKSLHEYFRLSRTEGEYFTTEPQLIKEKLDFVLGNMNKIYGDNI
jgi:Meiotically up-regulated gene 113